MKLKSFVKLTICAGLLALPIASNALETKLSGEFWGRWINETAKKKDAAGAYTDKMVKNYFSLERGYFGLETKFSESTKGRFTIDIFSTDATHEYQAYTLSDSSQVALPVEPSSLTSSAKTGSLDGAGLKIKYAYVDFANLTPIPDLTLTVGMQKTFFGTIYDWNYSLIGKAPTDEYKVANSSDLGVTLNGYIPKGFGEYAFGVYNGEGYKKVGASLKENTSFAYLANLRLNPIPGVTVGGSYMTNTVGRDKALDGEAVNKAYEEQALMDAVVRLAYGPADVWAEYISKDVTYPEETSSSKTQEYTATGISIFPTISLKEYVGYDIQLLGRYDTWDESDRIDADKAQSYLTATTLGANYNFLHDETANPAMQLQLNYTTKKYDEEKSHSDFADGMKDVSQINLQLKWRFANTIN
ncbi:MAG: hypothetical protein PHO32_01925 [Candidatus Cloacimonetes bacterium]|nr:hypothetical protein [Candidatus Cloacimonadota bacterium]